MKECAKSEWLAGGHARVECRLTLRRDLVQDWHGFIAPNEHVVCIEVAWNRWSSRLAVPDGDHFARPVVAAVPEEVGDAAANLHAGETFE